MIGEQELEVEGRESSEAGFVERLRIDLRFGLGEEFVVVLPENRALRATGFEAVTVQMVCDFTGKLVEAVEVGVELVVAVGRPDETTVTKPLEDTVDRVAVVVAPVSDPGQFAAGRGSTAPRAPSRSAVREVDVGVLADEVLVAFDGASIRRNDSFSPAVAFRVDDPFSTRSATARER